MKENKKNKKKYKDIKIDTDYFDSNKSNIKEKKGYVIYQGIKYKNVKWENLVLEGINYKYPSKTKKNEALGVTWQETKHFFSKNTKRSLILANILPSILFLIILPIVFRLNEINEKNGNFGFVFNNIYIKTMIFFISLSLFCIGLVLVFQSLFLKRKYIFRTTRYRRGYLMFNNTTYQEILKCMNEKIKNEYISFVPIYTKRLKIRELDKKDRENYFNFAKNPNVNKYLMWENERSIDEADEVIKKARQNYENNQYFKLAIALKDSDSFIGYIGLSTYDLTVKTCQVVYAIDDAYWHQGYASEALNAFILYLIEVQKKEVIYAGHVEENVNSGKVLLKCGFERCESRDSNLVIHNEVKNITGYIYKR